MKYLYIVMPIVTIILIILTGYYIGTISPDKFCKDGLVHEQYYNEDFSRPTTAKCLEKDE